MRRLAASITRGLARSALVITTSGRQASRRSSRILIRWPDRKIIPSRRPAANPRQWCPGRAESGRTVEKTSRLGDCRLPAMMRVYRTANAVWVNSPSGVQIPEPPPLTSAFTKITDLGRSAGFVFQARFAHRLRTELPLPGLHDHPHPRKAMGRRMRSNAATALESPT